MKVRVQEIEDEKTWVCESCDILVEEGARWCLHCKIYWEDVDRGLFDEIYYEDSGAGVG